MNRSDFQSLARIRLREARSLLRAGYHEGAYYLAGYAVECALKACIARRTKRHDFPDKRTVDASYTHRLEDLVRVAGLQKSFSTSMRSDPALALNWAVVKDWTEESRYERKARHQARDLVRAISGQHGVLQWARRHW